MNNSGEQSDPTDPSVDAWCRLRGALKDVFAELGRGEAYLRTERADFYTRGSLVDNLSGQAVNTTTQAKRFQ